MTALAERNGKRQRRLGLPSLSMTILARVSSKTPSGRTRWGSAEGHTILSL
jgi:hypothetical protein